MAVTSVWGRFRQGNHGRGRTGLHPRWQIPWLRAGLGRVIVVEGARFCTFGVGYPCWIPIPWSSHALTCGRPRMACHARPQITGAQKRPLVSGAVTRQRRHVTAGVGVVSGSNGARHHGYQAETSCSAFADSDVPAPAGAAVRTTSSMERSRASMNQSKSSSVVAMFG